MMRRGYLWILGSIVATVSVARAAVAAEPAVAAQIKAEIEVALHSQERANANGENAEQLSRRFYAEDVVMVGEGDPHVKRGMAAAIVEMDEWMQSLGPQGQKGCHFHLEDPVIATQTTASTFVTLTCKANPPYLKEDETVRQLFVWKRSSQGWRVAMEMWGNGSL
jgi:ketosteroid isomerase-like protein